VIQYLSLAYQAYQLCSLVLVSLCLHLLTLFDLLFFSTRASQPSFTVSVIHLCSLLLLTFMLCAPYPIYAPFLFCAFQLLHSTSFYTPKSLSPAFFISSLFCILIVFVHLVHAMCAMLLHPLPMSSSLPDHCCNSSASLVVKPMRPSSLGVMPRLFSLSSSRDSSSSLSQSISFPLL
jgi:hypothetical protein